MSKKNIFAKFQDYVNKPKRNVFDLSFGNNLTTKFGQLTPVFCKEAIPGDSFKIHSRFALQFMPMKFPVQTPMRAFLHFFYVRNRTLWKDWMDFIGKTKDNLTLPYVQPVDKQKFFRVGGLADYLGVPNVLYSSDIVGFKPTTTNYTSYLFVNPSYKYVETYIANPQLDALTFQFHSTSDYQVKPEYIEYLNISDQYSNEPIQLASNLPENVGQMVYQWNAYSSAITFAQDSASEKIIGAYMFCKLPFTNQRASSCRLKLIGCVRNGFEPLSSDKTFFLVFTDADGKIKGFNSKLLSTNETIYLETAPTGPNPVYYYDIDSDLYSAMVSRGATHVYVGTYHNQKNSVTATYDWHETQCFTALAVEYSSNMNKYKVAFPSVEFFAGSNVNVIGESGDFSSTPYDSDIHLNALPFRAYEAIYNSYYRNAQNNPFVLDGVPEYNKYITTNEGGADYTQYDLFQRNWEYDFLTSAVQTPQQGDIAPLVGISVTGEATFQDENGNTYYASAQYDSDGNITGWTSHSPNMPQGSLRLLMDMAGTGISINDLRNVNAFQKFLENNIRHGLKYRDQIKSHFGVDVRYDELDMPEFIGGCSTDVNINKLSQTSESGDTPLGSFVGQASAYGESKHDITHYCDEHGFIIGILSVVPVPVYSQLLPKYFVKNEQLDYYFPEFGHLGYQPILQKEVSPLQTFYGNGNLNGVFGYNRAWYDYLDSTDEVHAQFRTTMRNFIMNRTFESEPQLGEDFLLVDPDQLNDVFLAGTDDDNIYAPESDKIIGSMYFNVSKKSPIPLFGIPKLD